jgi:hypothetical protein
MPSVDAQAPRVEGGETPSVWPGLKKPKPKTEAEITGTETKIQEILVFGHAIGLA